MGQVSMTLQSFKTRSGDWIVKLAVAVPKSGRRTLPLPADFVVTSVGQRLKDRLLFAFKQGQQGFDHGWIASHH